MKTRIVTATVLATLTVTVIAWLPVFVFTGVLVVISAIAAWEWCRLSSTSLHPLVQGGYSVGVAALVLGGVLYEPSWVPITLGASVVWLVLSCCVLLQIFGAPKVQIRSGFLLGLILLAPAPVVLIAILYSLEHGRLLVLWFCIVVWATDTFAFVVGKRLGRRKLAPTISPGKTLEGTLGGIVGGIAIGAVFIFLFRENSGLGDIEFRLWYLVAFVVSVLAVFGDLVESAVKRSAHQKDSGTLVPGHGGVLDRIDSLLCAAPIFGSWMFLFEKGVTSVTVAM